MRWFFALNAECNSFADYAEMAQVAVWSARRNTRLLPHFLYHGDDDPPLLQWMRNHGVEVWRCRSRFHDALSDLAQDLRQPIFRTCGGGAYLRLEIIDLLAAHGLPDTHVLYTDCDVIFRKDPEPGLRGRSCRFIACGPESMRGNSGDINTGVMLMHVARLRRLNREFLNFTRTQLRDSITGAFDQGAYRQFYGGPLPRFSWPWQRGWNSLPDEFNWKPYWGDNPEAIIIHFHGPKPFHQEWLETARDGHVLRDFSGGAYLALTHEWRELLRQIQSEEHAAPGRP